MILSFRVLASDKAFNRDHGVRKNSSNSWWNGLSPVTSHLMRSKNRSSLWWWTSRIALGVRWRYQNVRASSVMWWRWVRKQLKEFVTCSWYDLSSFLCCDILTIWIETWGKDLPFTWRMDVKQSICLLGHCRTLCDQWRRTWFILHTISLDHAFTLPYRGAFNWLLRTHRGAFRWEYGRGHLGDNGAIWAHWKGEFPSLRDSVIQSSDMFTDHCCRDGQRE